MHVSLTPELENLVKSRLKVAAIIHPARSFAKRYTCGKNKKSCVNCE